MQNARLNTSLSKRSTKFTGALIELYSDTGLCAHMFNMCSNQCMSVCMHTGKLLDFLMEGHYILISSASVLWVWSTAALTPSTLTESDSKGHPCGPLYVPSLAVLASHHSLCLTSASPFSLFLYFYRTDIFLTAFFLMKCFDPPSMPLKTTD